MLRGLGAVLAILAGTSGVAANCYEIIGCDDSSHFSRSDLNRMSCQSLWEVRNLIYQQNGYCFQTERARNAFGNSGCWITNQSEVRLNAYERENVARILRAEKAKGCN